MQRHIERWYSDNAGQEMGVARYGWWGKPVVFFPTGGGDFLDCERFLMVRALTHLSKFIIAPALSLVPDPRAPPKGC